MWAGVPAAIAALGVLDGEVGVLLGQLAHKLGQGLVDVVRHDTEDGVIVVHITDHVWQSQHDTRHTTHASDNIVGAARAERVPSCIMPATTLPSFW